MKTESDIHQLSERETQRPPSRKSKELIELERLVNVQDRLDHPDTDQRYSSPRTFQDHTASGLTSCIIRYIFLLDGTAERKENFIVASFRGYSLKIIVAPGPGKSSFNERRETIEMVVYDFAGFKRMLDEL